MGFFRKRAERPRTRQAQVAPEPCFEPVDLETLSAIRNFTREPTQEAGFDYGPHLIVFANEKGGVGKSTAAFHTSISLCNAGESVAVVDLDHRQQSLMTALRKRQEMGRHLDIEFPMPELVKLHANNAESLDEMLRAHRKKTDFIVIDIAGHNSTVARHAISIANTVVTPINDSFVDIEVLGHVDPTNLEFRTLAPFARLVKTAMERRITSIRGPMDWIVVQNRLRSLQTKNGQKFFDVLRDISREAGFRLCAGLQERVIYRELVPFGLTLLDLDMIPDMASAHPNAEFELGSMLESLQLPSQKDHRLKQAG